MGRHELGSCSRPFETSLATPRGSLDAAMCQKGPGLAWECRWAWKHGLGTADAGDGAVTAMPTHPLPPVRYF